MAETTLTVRQILDLGLWVDVCDYKGWNYWIFNEGMISDDEYVTFDSEFKKPEDEQNLCMEDMTKLKGIINQLESIGSNLDPHELRQIDEAIVLLETYID